MTPLTASPLLLVVTIFVIGHINNAIRYAAARNCSASSMFSKSVECPGLTITFKCYHGECSGFWDGYFFGCECEPGWTGTWCEQCICDLNCPVGERCEFDQDGNMTCEVDPGYTTPNGTTLESVTTSCSASSGFSKSVECPGLTITFKCYHGECSGFWNGYFFGCECEPGWTGTWCEQCICDLNCPVGERCEFDQDGNMTCEVDPGYTTPNGTTLEPVTTNCSASSGFSKSVECPGLTMTFKCYHGECSGFWDGYFFGCECEPGWTGTWCEQCICDLNCPVGERCEFDQDGNMTCEVDPGYTTPNGTTLESVTTNCSSTPRETVTYCMGYPCHHGECEPEGFLCHCDEGWDGDHCNYCCDLPCLNNSTCEYHPIFKNMTCDCLEGYEEWDCSFKLPDPTVGSENLSYYLNTNSNIVTV